MTDDTATQDPTEPTPDERWHTRTARTLRQHRRTALIVTGAALAGAALITAPTIVGYALLCLAVLTLTVLVHELGHYRSAKKAGLAMTEFSIGFGPRLLSRVDSEGMRWSLKAIPFGGSVHIRGMTVEQAEEHEVPEDQAFVYAGARTRLRVVLAGVGINLLTAWALLSIVALYVVPEKSFLGVLAAPIAGLVAMGAIITYSLRAIMATILAGGTGAGSVLTMPGAVEDGVASSVAADQPLWVYFLTVMALLNVSVAVMNVLPFNPLDGYHAVVAVIDGCRKTYARMLRRAVPTPLRERQLATFARGTLCIAVAFTVVILGRDVVRLAQGG